MEDLLAQHPALDTFDEEEPVPVPVKKQPSRPEVAEELVDDDDPWAMFRKVVVVLTFDAIRERYKDIGIIAQNRNCTVRLCIHNRTGEKVVMKVLNKNSLADAKKRLLLLREIQTLRCLAYEKHIVQLFDCIDSGDRIWVIMEYGAGGELFDFVKAKAPLVESQAREIFRPIVKVVAFMHEKKLVHRDLKLENILLSTKAKILLADFGFSRYWDPEGALVDSLCGTPHYIPPEIVKGIPHDPRYADSWSLGVILFMLFFGRFPFTGLSIPEMQKSIMQAELVLPFGLSDLSTDLLGKLITLEPNDRLLPSEIMQHAWYNKNRMPHAKKKIVDKTLIHKVVLHDLGITDEIPRDEVEEMIDEDDLVAYKIIFRRYQNHELQIPIQGQHGQVGMPVLTTDKPSSTRRTDAITSERGNSRGIVMGMKTDRVRERLPTLDPYLRCVNVKIKTPQRAKTSMKREQLQKTAPQVTSHKRDVDVLAMLGGTTGFQQTGQPLPVVRARGRARGGAKNRESLSALEIRTRQTLRLKTIDIEEGGEDRGALPQFSCDHTTLDPLPEIWRRILTFLEKEKVSIITEQDFRLFIVVDEESGLSLSLNLGCVHASFGVIGYTLYLVHGEKWEFDDFEARMKEYMGF